MEPDVHRVEADAQRGGYHGFGEFFVFTEDKGRSIVRRKCRWRVSMTCHERQTCENTAQDARSYPFVPIPISCTAA
jgi:hypothetical protein